MKNSNSRKVRVLVFTAVFIALICLTTAFIMHIPVGLGYIHLGDSLIYLGATVLPFPFGIIAGALGGSLADLITGYTIYVIPTLIVKSINASCFYIVRKKSLKIISKQVIIAAFFSSFVTIIGYYFVAIILYGNPKAQLIVLIPNSIQAFSSLAIFIILGISLDKISFKKRFSLGNNMEK